MAQLNSGAPHHELLTVLDALLKQGLVTVKRPAGVASFTMWRPLKISATGHESLRLRDNPDSTSGTICRTRRSWRPHC